jgi:NAD(P)H-dependent flavin oxidoreductase YrpB (nitropropane dioxygenase family)
MTITTEFAEALGVEHPIAQGSMQRVAHADLAAMVTPSHAVSA